MKAFRESCDAKIIILNIWEKSTQSCKEIIKIKFMLLNSVGNCHTAAVLMSNSLSLFSSLIHSLVTHDIT